MDSKYLLVIMALISYSNCASMLRRTPKVYNALITTDDNLQSSRAFPVIQPTIHETGIAHYPFGPAFNPYRFYSPPLVHGPPQGFPTGPHGFPTGPTGPQSPPTGPQGYPTGPPPFNMGSQQEQPSGYPHVQFLPHGHGQFPFPGPQPPQAPQPNPQQPMPGDIPPPPETRDQVTQPPANPEVDAKQDQLPVIPAGERPPQPLQVPLNEFGLPPSLIPLHPFHQHHHHPHNPHNHINLQPYPYNSYPLIYDQFNQFPSHHHDPYLPPYGYYPPHIYGVHPQFGPKPPQKHNKPPSATPAPADPNKPEASEQQPDDATKNMDDPAANSENSMSQPYITNGAENKNTNVPDVPPPPLPSGAKKVRKPNV